MRETEKIYAKHQERKGEPPAEPLSISHGAWPPNVGIHRVAWHNGGGLARAPLLASGTASGLCRVDWLVGRFVGDKFPFKSIEVLRGEVSGENEDVEMDDEDDA